MLPKNRPLSDIDINKFANLYLHHFRGVFMRNDLPTKYKSVECGVINLDDKDGNGTHWCAYYKINNKCYYFDSFGNLKPPHEFINYLGSKCLIFYNYGRYQDYDTFNCGHLCLQFLYEMSKIK